MRLRQLCLVAQDLEPTLDTLAALLGVPVSYRDPGVGHFGLANGLFAVGGDFLEVISPIEPNTAGGRHLARHGDSGYMVLLQCEDAKIHRARITEMGVRAVWSIDEDRFENVFATHFHPRDVGAAILSIDSMGVDDWRAPLSRWVWAGEDWPQNVDQGKSSVQMSKFAAADIAASDPPALAAHWGRLLQRPVREQEGDFILDLDEAALRFVPLKEGADRLQAIDFTASAEGKERFYRTAQNMNLARDGDAVVVCGTHLRVV